MNDVMQKALSGFSYEDALSLTYPVKEFYWGKHNLHVLRDGYLDDGIRVHVVKEQDYVSPKAIDGAIVISERYN